MALGGLAAQGFVAPAAGAAGLLGEMVEWSAEYSSNTIV